MPDSNYSKRCWFTFPTRKQVEQPIIWQMSQTYPDVSFDIRQASVQNEIGIMAVLLKGDEPRVKSAIAPSKSRVSARTVPRVAHSHPRSGAIAIA